MRVVFLSTFGEACGIATYSEALVPALREAGADVSVIAPRLRKSSAGDKAIPRMWGRNRAFGVEALPVLLAIRKARADVVHAQINLSLFSSRFLFNLATGLAAIGIPLVATLHGRRGGSWGRDFKMRRLYFALRNADVVVHSREHAAEMPNHRTHVIAHGADPVASRSMAEARALLGIDPRAEVIGHFGFLVPDKGVADVIRAVAELRRTTRPKLEYWVAGAVYDSDESRAHFDELEALVKDLGVGSAVKMDGEFLSKERAMLMLQAADWVLLNYRSGNSQGASGAARYALASGRPVAVSSAEVFDDLRDATAPLTPPLAGCIDRLLNDKELANEVMAKAAAYCDATSWSAVARAHLALYESVTNRP